ncbi:MAG: hypothetical protein H0T13_03920 [Actinobacteria bacterium]|nr:hypothetical protein [Actinomycetota bacterium]
MVWELVFMLVILKIPVVYLCAVVWWAIRSEPRPLAGAQLRSSLEPTPGCDWGRRGRRKPAPRGGRRSGARARARARRTVDA